MNRIGHGLSAAHGKRRGNRLSGAGPHPTLLIPKDIFRAFTILPLSARRCKGKNHLIFTPNCHGISETFSKSCEKRQKRGHFRRGFRQRVKSHRFLVFSLPAPGIRPQKDLTSGRIADIISIILFGRFYALKQMQPNPRGKIRRRLLVSACQKRTACRPKNERGTHPNA